MKQRRSHTYDDKDSLGRKLCKGLCVARKVERKIAGAFFCFFLFLQHLLFLSFLPSLCPLFLQNLQPATRTPSLSSNPLAVSFGLFVFALSLDSSWNHCSFPSFPSFPSSFPFLMMAATMKVVVKDLTQKKYELELEPTTTVSPSPLFTLFPVLVSCFLFFE